VAPDSISPRNVTSDFGFSTNFSEAFDSVSNRTFLFVS
jgi:hypothetical protein